MAQTFTRPAPRGTYPSPDLFNANEYTRPLAAGTPPAARPQPNAYGQPWPPAHPAVSFSPVVARPAGPAWAGPYAGPTLPPGPWGPPPANHGPRSRGWVWGAAAGVAALTVTAAVIAGAMNSRHGVARATPVAAFTPSSQPSVAPAPVPAAPTLVDDSQLPRMVPTDAHVAEVAGAASLEPMAEQSGPGLLSDYSEPAGCAGAVVPATKAAYAGSGVRATFVQALHDPDRHQLHLVFDTVSTFDTSSAATSFVTAQTAAWRSCQAAPILLDPAQEKPTTWAVGEITQNGDMLTARTHLRDSAAQCQRALVANLNLVADVQVCTGTVTDAAATLATEIVRHIGQPS
ncbi:MAG: sensor domain-containing protein [Mycobacterium sp.]|nr:sensor domain-containing protein [Mycobacterium sp.]